MRHGNIIVDVLTQLGRWGRRGGGVSLLLGAVICASGGALTLAGGIPDGHGSIWIFYSPAAFALGSPFLLLGFALLLGAGRQWARDDRFKPIPAAELLVAAERARRPFFVCLDCKVLLPFEVAVGRCPRCESASSCLEVATAADLKMLRAALEPLTPE